MTITILLPDYYMVGWQGLAGDMGNVVKHGPYYRPQLSMSDSGNIRIHGTSVNVDI